MELPEQYRAAESLEVHLGNPADPATLVSFRRVVELDEREEFPADALAHAQDWGVHEYLVPVELGGKLRSFEEAYSISKVLTRRDMTLGVANGQTFLGSVFTWIAGSDELKARLAEVVLQRGLGALALTEEAHGADVVATELRADEAGEGYLLSGEKWFINNATRSRALCVFARTADKGGPRDFSLFLVLKDEVDEGTLRYGPKFPVLGGRGLDISSVALERCFVPSSAVVGRPGLGLELVMKGLYCTRSICPGLALGGADTALRTVLGFARERRLYGDTVFEIPHAQSVFVDSFIDLLVCDAVGVLAARNLHFAPEQASASSAIAKFFVPTLVETTARNLAVVLGARYFSRDKYRFGIFQKCLRDVSMVPLFDGSTVVNLYALGLQLPALTERWTKTGPDDEAVSAKVRALATLREAPPPFQPNRLAVSNNGQEHVVQGLAGAVALLERLGDEPLGRAPAAGVVLVRARALLEEAGRQAELLAAVPGGDRHEVVKSAELFDLAKRYASLYAGAACLHLWLNNQGVLGEFFDRGEWLALALDRLLVGLNARPATPLPREYRASAARELVRLHAERRLFSLVPIQLQDGDS